MLALSGVGEEAQSLVDMTGAVRLRVLLEVGGRGDTCDGEKDGGGKYELHDWQGSSYEEILMRKNKLNHGRDYILIVLVVIW